MVAAGAIVDDLLTSDELVCSPHVELARLRLAGVRLGVASGEIPRERIVDVSFSPIVERYEYATGARTRFFDAAGKELAMSEVIDSGAPRKSRTDC